MLESIRKILKLSPLRYSKIGEDLYFTDSKIAFRLLGAAKLFDGDKLETMKPENFKEIFEKNAIESPEPAIIDKICALADAPLLCQRCDGKGRVFICRACKGAGAIYCYHCENTNTCQQCDGCGLDSDGDEATCDYCHGLGARIQPAPLFGCHIDVRLLRFIGEVVPGAVIFRPEKKQTLLL